MVLGHGQEKGLPGSAGKGDGDLGLPAAFLVLPPACTDLASAQHPLKERLLKNQCFTIHGAAW